MCDCIKYKQFFTESNDEEFFLLKEELSNSQQPEPTEYEKKLIDLYNPPNNFSIRKIARHLKIDRNVIQNQFKKLFVTYPHLIQKKERRPIPNGMSIKDYEIYKKISFPSITYGTQQQYIRNYRKKLGQCQWCGEKAQINPDGTYTTFCAKHAQYAFSKSIKRKQSLKQYGMCISCGLPATKNADGTMSAYCTQHRKYFRDKSVETNKLRRKLGMCVACGTPAIKNADGSSSKFCEKHRTMYLKLNKNLKYKQKQIAVEYKGGKCELCGYNKNIAAMDFHHINPSEKDWITFSGKSLDKIKEELDKCRLVCKNCHNTIHYKVEKNKMGQRREDRKKACLEYKNTNSCTKCKITGVSRILQFHHIGLKDPNYNTFFQWTDWTRPENWKIEYEKTGKLPERIQNELDKCEVLCANCHAETHFDPSTGDTTEEFDKEIPKEECTDDTCKHSHT